MIYIGEGVLHLADDVTVESGGEIPQDWIDANKDAVQSLTDRGLTDGKPSEKKQVSGDNQEEIKRLNSEIKRLESELKKSGDKKSEKIIEDLKSEIESIKSLGLADQESIETLKEEISDVNIYVESLKQQIIDLGKIPVEPVEKSEEKKSLLGKIFGKGK